MVKDMDTRLRIQRPTRKAWQIAEVPHSASPTKSSSNKAQAINAARGRRDLRAKRRTSHHPQLSRLSIHSRQWSIAGSSILVTALPELIEGHAVAGRTFTHHPLPSCSEGHGMLPKVVPNSSKRRGAISMRQHDDNAALDATG
jgi:hypothetical protein